MVHVDRIWEPQDTFGVSRKDCAGGRYRAFVPDELAPDLAPLSAAAERAAQDALRALTRADERVGTNGRFLNHLLIRSESIASSWIEGNRVTPKHLAIAELLRQGKPVTLDVVANVRATEDAIAALADHTRPIRVADIEALQHTIEPGLSFGIRTEQNWVGGPGYSPLRADFIPPSETEVPRLIGNLAEFVTATEGNPVVRAAIAHAQFETIHPFVDGNGRTGRALIHAVLKRADALRNILIPISTVFAGAKNSYIDGLTEYRSGRVDEWVIAFAQAAEVAAANAVRLADDVQRLDAETLEQLIAWRTQQQLSPARPRRDAVALRIVGRLATEPVVTSDSVAAAHGVSNVAAYKVLTQLGDAGVLSRNKDHKGRVVCWSADRYLALVALTERSNRVGGADTAGRTPPRGPGVPIAASSETEDN